MRFIAGCLVSVVAIACSSGNEPTSAAGGGAGGAVNGAGGGAAAGAASAGAAGATLAGGGMAATAGGAGASGGTGGASAAGSAGVSGSAASAGTGGSAGSAGAAPVATPALHWIGRVEPTASGGKLSWPGTGVSARFNGTGAHVTLKTQGVDYFELVVDGKESVLTTQAGTKVYDMATGLSAGDHTLTLWRRTEPNNGSVELGPVTFDGKLLAPPAYTKHLEIVGDSISVGFGVECKTQAEAFAFATENNYLTYEALSARKLNAELYSEAWSGIGMWRDVGGSTTVDNQMPGRYLLTVPNGTTTKWDFSDYVPDAVLVLLGTNDFAKGDPGQPFVDAYKAFVATLRTHYPQARQYYAVSPMLGGTNRTQHKAYLGQVVSARNAAKDTNVAIIEFAQPAADAWGCGHPNAATHAIMAGVLEAALTKDLGW